MGEQDNERLEDEEVASAAAEDEDTPDVEGHARVMAKAADPAKFSGPERTA